MPCTDCKAPSASTESHVAAWAATQAKLAQVPLMDQASRPHRSTGLPLRAIYLESAIKHVQLRQLHYNEQVCNADVLSSHEGC